MAFCMLNDETLQWSPLHNGLLHLYHGNNTVCMYENVQAPMMEAVTGGNTPASASLAVNPFKTLLQGGNASGLLVTVRSTSHFLPRSIIAVSFSHRSPGRRLQEGLDSLRLTLHPCSVAIPSPRLALLQGRHPILSLRWAQVA